MFGKLKRLNPLVEENCLINDEVPIEKSRLAPASSGVHRSCLAPASSGMQTVQFGSHCGSGVTVPLRLFASHLSVTGGTGMGKTTATLSIVRQLVDRGISVVVFEPAKVEYARKLARSGIPVDVFSGAALGGAKPLCVNPFAVDEGVVPRLWAQDLALCLEDAYGMHEQPLPLHLSAMISRLYRNAGSSSDTCRSQWPTVKDFLCQVEPYMEEETCAGKEVSSNVQGALTLRARSMCQTPELLSKEGLMASDLLNFGPKVKVFQLADSGREIARFTGMLLLMRIVSVARRFEGRPLHTVVILEEAHSLLCDPLDGSQTAFAGIYQQALAELRSTGIGFMTIEQRPSLLPTGVFANSITKLSFASTHGDDRDVIRKAYGLTEEQMRRFGSMPMGTALFQTAGINGGVEVKLPGA